MEGWSRPRLRFPGRRAGAHHAGQASALPGTRGRLLREILPVWLQHCLLGESGVGSGPRAGGGGRRRFSPLLGWGGPLPALRAWDRHLSPPPSSHSHLHAHSQDHSRELRGGPDCWRRVPGASGVGYGGGVSLYLPKPGWRKGRCFLEGLRDLSPVQLLCYPGVWGVGCALSSAPGLVHREECP